MATIIIADDDIQMLTALQVRLEADGHEVHGAQDAYFALQLARDEQADLLVLDINMPAGDGFSVQERLRNIPDLADTPVVYITGEHSPRVTDGAAAHGAFAVVHKPFASETLRTVIHEALASTPSTT